MDGKVARRDFLMSAGALLLGNSSFGLPGSLVAKTAGADTPPIGAKIPRLLSGCSAFSFRKQLVSGQMTMEDFIRKAVELRLDGVDMTVYYLKSTEPGYLESLRSLAYRNAVAILGAACGTRTVQADSGKRAEALIDLKKWVDVTERLGAPQLRVFAGILPEGSSLEQGIAWVVEIMKAATDYSGKKGIALTIENNRGVSQTSDACLEMMRRIDSPYAGITLDITHFVPTPAQDAYAQIAACIPCTTNTHILDRFDDWTPIDLERIWKLFAQAGYRGYMSLEYDAKPGDVDASGTEIPRLVSVIRALCRKYSSTAS